MAHRGAPDGQGAFGGVNGGLCRR